MREILFATTNARKINEANGTLKSFGIEVKPTAIDIDEIQHLNPAEITKAKAKSAYEALKKPVVVSDTSWDIPTLGGFPGGYMKDVGIWWSEDDWLTVMKRHDDKSANCLEHLAYFDGKEIAHFSHSYKGKFLTEVRGPVVNKIESFERVISLNGKESLSEQIANNNFAVQSLGHWVQFGEWFNNK